MTKGGALLLLAVGVAIALAVSIGGFKWLKAKAQAQVRIQETVDVAVTARDVPWGTVLTSGMVTYMPYLKATLPNGYHTKSEAVEGRVVIRPLARNEPIFESGLAPRDVTKGGMAAVVAPRKRAMAVKVDKIIGVSGFIFPGNRVDVIVSLGGREQQQATTKIVLQNVLVLATGTELEKTGKQEKPSPVDVITLEVTPEEGEKLALAATEGRLQLALRNYADSGDAVTRGATFPTLMGSPAAQAKAASRQEPARPRREAKPRLKPEATVEFMQGNVVTRMKFSEEE